MSRDGTTTRLQPKVMGVLVCLAKNAGVAVSKEELLETVWPGTAISDDVLSRAISELRRVFADDAHKPTMIETVAKRGYRLLRTVQQVHARRVESMMVLPLDNLSGDPKQEYFADGLTEGLITNLAKISALRVVSRATSMHYKSVRRPLREIACELRVDAIVTGSVLRSRGRVRISVQLIDGATDTNLWAESYDRDLRDVLGIQREVTQAIVREIQVKLTAPEETKLARTQAVDPEAYDAYLKGRYYWNKRSRAGLEKGTEYFKLAIEKDPTYAAAYAGLADCAGIVGWWGLEPSDICFGRAKAAARKALEIDESAEAHASLGWTALHYDWDFVQSEREFKRAIELSPSYATARQWYGHLLLSKRLFDDAVQTLECAQRFDPLSSIIGVSYAGVLWCARRFDESIEQSQRTLELDPNFPLLRWILAMALEGKGLYDAAIIELEKGVDLSDCTPLFVAALGHAYAIAGRTGDAIGVLHQLEELSRHRYVGAMWRSVVYAGLNANDEVIAHLERACIERSAWIPHLNHFPTFDHMRSDPRFENLLRRMNLPV